jgi:hypothetical protein
MTTSTHAALAVATTPAERLAAIMLNGANCEKYGELKCSMAENYVMGTSKYPESPEGVLRILNAYVPTAG